MSQPLSRKPDYGVDAPNVLRTLFIVGSLALLMIFVTPKTLHFGHVNVLWHRSLGSIGGFLLAEAFLFLLYVKYGKFRHRDLMLGMRSWTGAEQVLDVGCGRGLLLVGAAKRLTSGAATGIDVWSNTDMGGNSEAATRHNLDLEGVSGHCSLVSQSAHDMPFADESFDVVLSNLCLHNIHDKAMRRQALQEIVRVLKTGGVALISDYKLTGEYAAEFKAGGLRVETQWASFATTFPPLRVVRAYKTA